MSEVNQGSSFILLHVDIQFSPSMIYWRIFFPNKAYYFSLCQGFCTQLACITASHLVWENRLPSIKSQVCILPLLGLCSWRSAAFHGAYPTSRDYLRLAVPKPPYGLSPRSILWGTPALNMRLFPSSKFTCGKVSFLGLNDGASQSLNFGGH